MDHFSNYNLDSLDNISIRSSFQKLTVSDERKFISSTPVPLENETQLAVDLNSLTEDEHRTIMSVLDKDLNLRRLEETRLM
jgi:hypothetical protein